MVDTTDLKSVDLISREGSSPSTPIYNVMTNLKNLLKMFDNSSYNFIQECNLK